MLFNQFVFFEFLALVILGNLLVHRIAVLHKLMIIAASFVFFLSWGGANVLLFTIVILVNYPIAWLIFRTHGNRSHWLLIAVITVDLSVLAYFKYFDFIVGQFMVLPKGSAWAPLGLSFYTFHLISYQVDIYRRKCAPGAPLDYVGYLSFFPHLIAGPIVRRLQLMSQFEAPMTLSRMNWSGGLVAFAVGLFLKNAADMIAPTISPAFTPAGVAHLTSADAWTAAVLFSCQIFGDFAGYSYMAIGVGRLLGYELPTNFNAPYTAESFREFWHHWHITLSQWLRDYLYIGALGGNRKGPVRTQINILLTMLLGGLWHGANWTFVLWGGVHGSALVIERWLGLEEPQKRALWVRAAWFCAVQFVVLIAWVIFRSPNFSVAAEFLHRMGELRSLLRLNTINAQVWLLTLPVFGYHVGWRFMQGWKVDEPIITGAVSMLLLILGIMMIDQPVTFIYFAF